MDGDERRERGGGLDTEGSREAAGDRSSATGGHVTYAQFRIQLPPGLWVRDLSKAYPNATFRLLAGIERDGVATELGETLTDEPEAVETAMREHDSVGSCERLERTDDRLLVRYETTDTALYAFLRECGLPPEFPVEVQNGWYELNFTGGREAFERLTATLSASPLSYELLSKISSSDTADVVTPRQREVLGAALRHGYLDVPRGCTLAELADELDADKSTISGVLRRGQARIVERFLTSGV